MNSWRRWTTILLQVTSRCPPKPKLHIRESILEPMRHTIAILSAGILAGLLASGLHAQRGPAREIIKITDNLYRTRNGGWYGLFFVTPEGIVLADPINPDFAAWAKTELDRRFPGVPVRYVIYSHSHWDHIEGGAAFAETARFVAQEG